ncbi:B12-binding domain-containing protein [Chryseomicrobium aureum]|uniref:cobalamin B12-binding domain-containing protein n=1 Tax=Chryseomicrobium aureum TaxID=1441723 RepID=UPI00370DCBD6
MNKIDQLASYLLDGDEERAIQLVEKEMNQTSRQEMMNDLLTPAMQHIGNLWENNKITVADEHLATAICDFILSRLDIHLAPVERNEKTVLLMGVQDEEHYIGLKMVSSIFKQYGWRVRYLGPNMPESHAIKAIERWQPDVIAISAALVHRIMAIQSLVLKLKEDCPDIEVVIGGRITQQIDLHTLLPSSVTIMDSLPSLENWVKEGGPSGKKIS